MARVSYSRHPTVGAPWRVAIFVVASAIGFLLLRLVLPYLAALLESSTGVRLDVVPWLLMGALLIGHAWTFRIADPRGWRFVGLGREALAGREIARATLLGALAVGVPSAVLLASGWLDAQPGAPGSSLGLAGRALIVLAPAAMGEELLMRGYLFAALRDSWGGLVALGVTSIFFGALHLENVGATVQSVTLVTLAGVFLGGIVLVTGSLWAAWAAHLAWNFVLVALLHTPVSGIGFATPDYRVVDSGPDWATGGIWGPEGGAAAALGLTIGLGYLYRRHKSREA